MAEEISGFLTDPFVHKMMIQGPKLVFRVPEDPGIAMWASLVQMKGIIFWILLMSHSV